ncbi:MAG: hypothetical protein E7K04_05630, partial [Helicobacter sp.]|nr:hypothetical protein [Helicobacter sp.]
MRVKVTLLGSFSLCFLYFGQTLQAVSNNAVTQVQSSYDKDTIIDYNIDYNGTTGQIGADPNGCAANSANCYSGILFNQNANGANELITLNNNANLTLNFNGVNSYNGYSAALFRGAEGGVYRTSGGTLSINLNALPKSGDGIEAVFLTQRTGLNKAGRFYFDSDIKIRAGDDFYIQRGIFTANGPQNGENGEFQFNKNVDIDILRMRPSDGWGAAKSGVGYRMMFSIQQKGRAYINFNPQLRRTYNRANIIRLRGDVSVEADTTTDGEVILHLTNKQSFLEGRFSLQGQANAELLLDNG